MKKSYIIFDARANYDEDEASVLESCSSLKEAKESIKDYPSDSVLFEYDIEPNNENDGTLINPRRINLT